MQLIQPVKFLGTETRSFGTAEKSFDLTEATIFINDLGRVKVRVVGKPSLPPVGAVVNLKLVPEQGKYQALVLVWNEAATYTLVK